MIYFVKDWYFPDFGGFGWTDGAKYALPTYMPKVYAIESSATWEEIEALYAAAYPAKDLGNGYIHTYPQPKLVESAASAPFRDRIVALGQLILPLNFFRRPTERHPPIEGARRYKPVEPWRVYVGNMDGDTSWWKGRVREDGLDEPMDFHEPLPAAFDALTSDLEGNIWVDWHRFPPKQQTLMQHWAAEVSARRSGQ